MVKVMTREKTDQNSAPAVLAEELAAAGAAFRITRGGSLFVDGLAELPADLQRRFLNCSKPADLVAAVRARTDKSYKSDT